MADTFPKAEELEESDWMSASYEERLQIIQRYLENFVLIDPELKQDIFIFLTDELRMKDLILILRNNKAFRNLFRDIIDYLFSPYEEFIELEDTFDKYTEVRDAMFRLRYTAHLDPQDKLTLLLMESTRRHTWNDFGITPDVVRDFENPDTYEYDYSFFDKLRLLTKWLLLDLLDYYDSLDTVEA